MKTVFLSSKIHAHTVEMSLIIQFYFVFSLGEERFTLEKKTAKRKNNINRDSKQFSYLLRRDFDECVA